MNLIRRIGAAHTALILRFLLTAATHGQVPADTPLHLDELLAELKANNPTLRAARLESHAIAHQSRAVSAWPDPTVGVDYQPFSLLTARGTQRSQWRVEQTIPFPGKLGFQGEIADFSAEVADFEAETLEEDLCFQVKQAYYELYRIQQQQQLVLAFQDRLESFEEVAATQYEVGVGMQQAILKAQLEKTTLALVQLDLAGRRRTAAETLARLLNRPNADALMTDIQVATPPFLDLDEAELMEISLRERPEVSALKAAARRAQAQIALAHKQFRPDFSLSITYFDIGRTEIPATATGRDAIAIGASIKVPIQRDRLRARLEEVHVRRSQVEARQEALETSLRTQIADLVSRLRQEAGQLILFQEGLIPQAETTLQASLSAYTTGAADFLDLLDAERMLFSLGRNYENTFALHLTTIAALERALGITSLIDLYTP